jgi:hypothetical protein
MKGLSRAFLSRENDVQEARILERRKPEKRSSFDRSKVEMRHSFSDFLKIPWN